MAAPVGNLTADSTAFFLCDMQEKFKPAIQFFTDIVEVAKRLTETSKILEIPLIVTEQYPKGLGSTVSDLDITHAVGVFPKTKFSMVIPPVEEELLKRPNVKAVVLFGIEAHVCVQQTALDLLARGLEVHIVVDACSSRSMMDRQFAYKIAQRSVDVCKSAQRRCFLQSVDLLCSQRLRQARVIITTSEAVIFQLLADANHPKFKEVQALVKAVAPTSGLGPNL